MAKKTPRKKEYPLRDVGILAAAATGKNNKQIAEEFGVNRHTVAKALNSEEAKRLTENARSDLKELFMDSVVTLKDALDNRHTDMKTAVNAAIAILKGGGVLTEKVEHEVSKPFIMELLDGRQIVMGHRAESDEEE